MAFATSNFAACSKCCYMQACRSSNPWSEIITYATGRRSWGLASIRSTEIINTGRTHHVLCLVSNPKISDRRNSSKCKARRTTAREMRQRKQLAPGSYAMVSCSNCKVKARWDLRAPALAPKRRKWSNLPSNRCCRVTVRIAVKTIL